VNPYLIADSGEQHFKLGDATFETRQIHAVVWLIQHCIQTGVMSETCSSMKGVRNLFVLNAVPSLSMSQTSCGRRTTLCLVGKTKDIQRSRDSKLDGCNSIFNVRANIETILPHGACLKFAIASWCA